MESDSLMPVLSDNALEGTNRSKYLRKWVIIEGYGYYQDCVKVISPLKGTTDVMSNSTVDPTFLGATDE